MENGIIPEMPRTRAPRFSIHERVQIRDVIMTAHTGKEGTVVGLRVIADSHTLDRYEVQLLSGEIDTFWDIQLCRAEPRIKKKTA
jgi:hypothetical protein